MPLYHLVPLPMPVCWVHKQQAYKTPCYRIREGRDLSTSLQIHLAEVKISKFFYQSEFPITLKYIILRQDDPFCVQNAVESHEQIKSRQVTPSHEKSNPVSWSHVNTRHFAGIKSKDVNSGQDFKTSLSSRWNTHCNISQHTLVCKVFSQQQQIQLWRTG